MYCVALDVVVSRRKPGIEVFVPFDLTRFRRSVGLAIHFTSLVPTSLHFTSLQ